MAQEDVAIKVSADMAEALRAWRQIADGPKALQEAMQRISELEGKNSSQWARNLDSIVGKWTSIAAAIGVVQQAVSATIEDVRRLRTESEKSTRDIDTATRGYAAWAGIKADTPEYGEAMRRITAAAQSSGAEPTAAFSAARLLAQFGFSRQEQQGAALNELLEFQDVIELSGRGNKDDLSRAILEILKRSGQPRTGRAVRQLGAATTQLLGSGAGFSAGQLNEYADIATVATEAGLDFQTGLSIWAAIREVEGKRRRADSLFRSLLDKKERPGEAQQLQAFRQRGTELLNAGGLSYQDILDLVGGSMAEREEATEARYQVSGYREGAVSSETIRKNLVAGIRQETGRAGSLKEYLNTAMYSFLTGEVPYLPGPMQPFFSPETAARMMLRGSPEERESQFQQLTGERPIVVNVRVQMPDGRDLPSTVEAAGIGGR